MEFHKRDKIIIDTDPGTDDALAIMMALNSKALSIECITTVGGNATLADTTRNTLRIIEHLGIPISHDLNKPGIPIVKGSSRPIKGTFRYGYSYHGKSALGVRLHPAKSTTYPANATEFIARIASEYPNQVTLVALGPLTNIAKAIISHPQFRKQVKQLVVMGGAIKIPGNVTKYAEFNIYNDPVAAELVFSSGIPTKLIPLDICTDVNFAKENSPWVKSKSATAILSNRILNNWFESHPDHLKYNLYDPMALVATIKPNLLKYKQAKITVLKGGTQSGRTVARHGNGSVKIAIGTDKCKSEEFISKLLAL